MALNEQKRTDGRLEATPASASTIVERFHALRRVAQPPEPPDVFTTFYRTLSIFLSIPLARTHITANQITVGWIALGLAGVMGLASLDYRVRLGGALLLQVSYLLDYVDGEVARLQGRTSKRGFFIDLMGHGLVKTALFLGIGYGLRTTASSDVAWVLAIIACVSMANAHTLSFYGAQASLADRPAPTPLSAALVRAPSLARRVREAIGFVFLSPGLFGLVLVGVVINRCEWILFFYGLVGPAWFFYRARKYRFDTPGATIAPPYENTH